MRVAQVSFSDSAGGASRACLRLHRAMLEAGHDVRLHVAHRGTQAPTVVPRSGATARVVDRVGIKLEAWLRGLQHEPGVFRSIGIVPSGIGRALSRSDADVLNLHWINDGALSIGEIGALAKPVVWTLHDAWAFCGAEHYPDGSPRPFEGYRADNRPAGQHGVDVDRWVWSMKRRAWRRPMTIVTPSGWLARTARSSLLMRDWDVRVVPNPLDLRHYRPLDRAACRGMLGLPHDRPVIVFGALGGTQDRRKGFDLLADALRHLAGRWRTHPRPVCVVFGEETPGHRPDLGLDLVWTGTLRDDLTLAITYSAADVVVVPSRQENLAQSATEAQACGIPVVAFDATGMPDAIEDGVSGLLARAYDPHEMAVRIEQVLCDDALRERLGRGARERALRLWAPEVVVPQYEAAFAEAIRSSANRAGPAGR